MADIRRLEPGEFLFHQGAPSREIFVLRKGEVVLETAAGPIRLLRVGSGQLVGELGLLEGTTRTATVKALGETEVLAIDGERFRRHLKESPEVVQLVVKALAQRLRNTNGLLQVAAERVTRLMDANREMGAEFQQLLRDLDLAPPEPSTVPGESEPAPKDG